MPPIDESGMEVDPGYIKNLEFDVTNEPHYRRRANLKNMEMSVSLKCSVCGNDEFTDTDDSVQDLMDAPHDTLIKCSDCNREVSKEKLIQENSHIIDANIEEFKKDIVKEFEKDLKKVFKK